MNLPSSAASCPVCVKYHEPPTLEIELNKRLDPLILLCLRDKTRYFTKWRILDF